MGVLLSIIIGFIKIIFILGVLITIHEAGHFIVAKFCDVKVNAFSIGFGPKLLKKKKGETEYTLRLFPFGGFVQMEGEEERSDDRRAFNQKSVLKRIAIVSAGALVNIIFAILLFFAITSISNKYVNNKVVDIDQGPLMEAGIISGDKIVKINGDKMLTYREILVKIAESESDDFVFEIERNGEIQKLNINIPFVGIGRIGAALGEIQNENIICKVFKGSSAEKMGILENDKIISVNGVETKTSKETINEIRKTVDKNIEIVVLRNNEEIVLNGEIQIQNDRILDFTCEIINPGFFKGFVYACDETWYFLTSTIKGYSEMFSGNAENVEVMGPVGIAGEITATENWFSFFNLMAAISLSLGILNLFPIPALDGGRILILIIEGVRRKPMEEKLEQGIIITGFAAIMIFALVVTVFDVINLF